MPLPPPVTTSTALVTGASSGIGAGIARELARRGHNTVLVARREDRLANLAAELEREFGVRAEALGCDLTDPAARGGLPDRVQALGLDVEILINNAGFATGGPFVESEPERELEQVRLLCEAPVGLCAALLPGMIGRGRGAILNVASTAGMQPLPFSAGYAAAKAHLLSFSEALHQELRDRGITVTALCPGPVRTEIFEKQDHPIERLPAVAWRETELVVRVGVEGLEEGRRVVVPGRLVWAGINAGRYVPNAVKLPLLGRILGPRRAASG